MLDLVGGRVDGRRRCKLRRNGCHWHRGRRRRGHRRRGHCRRLFRVDPRQLRLHGDGRLTLLLDVLVVRHHRQQFVEIRDRTRIVALGAEQLGAREIGCALVLRALRDGAGKILDRMIDIALAAIGLAAPEKCVLNIRVHRKRDVEIAHRLIELRGFDIGPRPPDIGRGQILAQRNRLVVVGDGFRPALLVAPEIAARQKRNRVLRLELDRTLQIGARQIDAAAALARIGTREQSRHEYGIQLQRSVGITERRIEFRTAEIKPRTTGKGCHTLLHRALRVIDQRGTGGFDLVLRRAVAVFQVPGAGRPGGSDRRRHQHQRRQPGKIEKKSHRVLYGPMEGWA